MRRRSKAKDTEEKQQKQTWQHDRSGVKLHELVIGDTVHVLNHEGGQVKWIHQHHCPLLW